MLRRFSPYTWPLVAAIDWIVGGIAYLLALWVIFPDLLGVDQIKSYLVPWLLFQGSWTLLSLKHRYRLQTREYSAFQEISKLTSHGAQSLLLSLLATVLLSVPPIGLKEGLLFICLKLLLTLGWRISAIALLQELRKRGFNFRNVVMVGINRRSLDAYDRILRHDELGWRIIGFVGLEHVSSKKEHQHDLSMLGTLDQLQEILRQHVVDIVLITLPLKSHYKEVEQVIALCEEKGTTCKIPMDIFNLKVAKSSLLMLEDIPFVSIFSGPPADFQLGVKRALDVAVSLIAIGFLWPWMLLIGLLVRLTSPGPVLFCQTRMGMNQRLFTMYKFRTMVTDAEEQKAQLLSRNEADGPVFKMAHDPRITPLGRFLRKFNLDELPQLFNVLRGDMSLVGPRPPVPSEVSKYDWQQYRRLSVRPGLTCLWQIAPMRNAVKFTEWISMDLKYIDNWSLFLDIQILLKTVRAVLIGSGR